MNNMSLSDHQFEFLKDVALLIQWVDRRGWKVTGGELHRLPETQEVLRAKGLSLTTEGNHPRRLAIDLMLFNEAKFLQDTKDYKELGDFWESLNPLNRWGGNFTRLADGVHFERNV